MMYNVTNVLYICHKFDLAQLITFLIFFIVCQSHTSIWASSLHIIHINIFLFIVLLLMNKYVPYVSSKDVGLLLPLETNLTVHVRQASNNTIFSLQRPAMAPYDADVLTTLCSVRPPAILQATFITFGRFRSLL